MTTTTKRALVVVYCIAIAALLVVTVVGTVGAMSKPDTFRMTGTFTLSQDAYTLGLLPNGDWECFGGDGYSDITQGAAVTVYGASETILAVSELSQGQTSDNQPCRFQFSVANVPAGQDMYQVEVTHRGKIAVPASKARNGAVTLSLG